MVDEDAFFVKEPNQDRCVLTSFQYVGGAELGKDPAVVKGFWLVPSQMDKLEVFTLWIVNDGDAKKLP